MARASLIGNGQSAGRIHPRPRPGHAFPRTDPGDLRRPRRAGPHGHALRPGREGLSPSRRSRPPWPTRSRASAAARSSSAPNGAESPAERPTLATPRHSQRSSIADGLGSDAPARAPESRKNFVSSAAVSSGASSGRKWPQSSAAAAHVVGPALPGHGQRRGPLLARGRPRARAPGTRCAGRRRDRRGRSPGRGRGRARAVVVAGRADRRGREGGTTYARMASSPIASGRPARAARSCGGKTISACGGDQRLGEGSRACARKYQW